MENLSTVDYSRQEALTHTLSNNYPLDSTSIIIGCGGIGFWLGIFLSLLGYKNFILIDGEKIDKSNLNRLPVPQSWVGVNKAVALRRIIRSFRLDTKILTLSTHITEDTLDVLDELASGFKNTSYAYDNPKTTIWDTTDNALIQKKIWEMVASKRQKYSYRKLGYEAFDVGCYSNMDVWTADDYETGYRTTNANAVTSALSAGLGIFARSLTDQDFAVNLRSLIQDNHGSMVSKTSVKDAINDIWDNDEDMAQEMYDAFKARGTV